MRHRTRLTGELLLCVTLGGVACLGLTRWTVARHATATAARQPADNASARRRLLLSWLPLLPSLAFAHRRFIRLATDDAKPLPTAATALEWIATPAEPR